MKLGACPTGIFAPGVGTAMLATLDVAEPDAVDGPDAVAEPDAVLPPAWFLCPPVRASVTPAAAPATSSSARAATSQPPPRPRRRCPARRPGPVGVTTGSAVVGGGARGCDTGQLEVGSPLDSYRSWVNSVG